MAKPSLAYIVIFLFKFKEDHVNQPTIYHTILTQGHFQLLKRRLLPAECLHSGWYCHPDNVFLNYRKPLWVVHLNIWNFMFIAWNKGRVTVPDRMNFRKSSKGRWEGGGSFSIQKIVLQILGLYTGLYKNWFSEKTAIWFSENERGSQRPFDFFQKKSSDFVAPPFPNQKLVDLTKCVDFFTYFFASPHCVDEIKAEMLMSFLFSFLHQMVIKEDTWVFLSDLDDQGKYISYWPIIYNLLVQIEKEKSRNIHKLCMHYDHLVKLHQFLTCICIEKRFLQDISIHLSLNAATATGQMRFRLEFCKIISHIFIIEFSPKCTIVPKQQAGIYVSIHLSLEAGLGDNLLASCPILHGQDKRGIRYSISKISAYQRWR